MLNFIFLIKKWCTYVLLKEKSYKQTSWCVAVKDKSYTNLHTLIQTLSHKALLTVMWVPHTHVRQKCIQVGVQKCFSGSIVSEKKYSLALFGCHCLFSYLFQIVAFLKIVLADSEK